MDGASQWQIFTRITLPLLRPVILVLLLLRIMDAFKVFDIVFTMTYGGPGQTTELLSMLIYKTGLRFFQIGQASAMSWVFLVGIFLISLYLHPKAAAPRMSARIRGGGNVHCLLRRFRWRRRASMVLLYALTFRCPGDHRVSDLLVDHDLGQGSRRHRDGPARDRADPLHPRQLPGRAGDARGRPRVHQQHCRRRQQHDPDHVPRLVGGLRPGQVVSLVRLPPGSPGLDPRHPHLSRR